MATVTYYMNAYSLATSWTNPANIVDNDDTTYGSFITPVAPVPSDTTGYVYTSQNNCSGVYLGVITKVEYRVKYYAGIGASGQAAVYSQPEFGGSSLGTKTTILGVTGGPIAVGPLYTAYIDITNDTNHPTWGTDWDNIKNIDINLDGRVVKLGAVAGVQSEVRFYYVEIRVTYIPFLPSQVL